MEHRYQGSCLCGEIRFSVSGFDNPTTNCYCSMCRKFHGAAFATLTEVQGLTWLSGQHLLKEFIAANGTIRTFCSHCGSSLGFRGKDCSHDDIELAIANFDDDIPITIDAQIYTAYKPSWCQLQADLPAFAEGWEDDT